MTRRLWKRYGVMVALVCVLCGTAVGQPKSDNEPMPRVSIVKSADGAYFTNVASGTPLLLKGFNYVRLRHQDHATFDAATEATAAHYDAARAEAMLSTLAANGFNVVRVFIIGRGRANPGIAGDVAETQGVYGPYMENVIDFLRRAERHGIYVFPTFGDGELPISQHYQAMLSGDHRGRNAIYFTREGIVAKATYVSDFLNYVKKSEPRLLRVLLGVQCQNELCVYSDSWPFTVKQGDLQMPNGKRYDMADAEQRRALMNEGLRHYHGELVKSIKKIDPDLLVAEGIFTQSAVGKSLEEHQGIWPEPGTDKRYPPDLVTLGSGDLDFIDIHYYRTAKTATLPANFHEHMHSSRFDAPAMTTIRRDKPIVLGEFGAFRFVEDDLSEVVSNIIAIRDLAISVGMKGFLYWTYDTVEQKRLYYATENDGELIKALAK